MLGYKLSFRKVSRSVLAVLIIFVLVVSLESVGGSVSYYLLKESNTTVSSPPVVLQNGTAGTSTIYANKTSAKVSVEAPLFDYVDNNDPDADSSADEGMHSNFPAQQAGPDSIYDTLEEENTEAIEDYVDNNLSDVDNSSDVGTHSNFENEKLKDGIYDILTESAEGIIRDEVTQGQDPSATVTFSHTLGYSSGNNRLVVVAAGFENSIGDINVTSATYDGQSMIKIVQATTGGSGYAASVAIFYLLDSSLPASSSSYSVVVTAASDPSADLWACAVSYTGVKQEAPDDYDSDYYVGSTTMTSNLDCDEDGSMLVQACVVGDTGSFTNSSGTTEVIEDNDIGSASAVFNEKLDQDSGARDLGCIHSSMNRGAWVGACWAPASEDYDLDIEVQFTSVIDFLPTEKLCIYTGTLGSEDVGVDYWNGTGWENLATDLNAYSCNEYTVSLTSSTFTIRFKGGTVGGDTSQDQWQIDASLLRVEGAGSKEDEVDQQSNADGLADVGTHGNFSALQYGPDSINDTLIEGNTGGASNTTLIDAESFEGTWPPTGWTETGAWDRENDQAYDGIYSADFDGPPFGSGSGDLDTPDLNCSDATAIYVSFYFREGVSMTYEFRLRFWNGSTWVNIEDLGGYSLGWHHWEMKVTDSQYFTSDFQIRWVANALESGESVYVDLVTVKKEIQNPDNYELDLEVRWTDLPYLLPNETLCIYGGTMGTEDIKVDVWNGTGWETVFTDLSSGWNNASVTDWLTTSNFTIRFKGGNETGDSSQDTWQIDVALLHIWHEGGESYELDLEVQWTGADYTQTNEELCIKTGTFSGSENIQVKVWNDTGSSWHWVMNLTASQWNNFSITSYLTSSTFTVQFLGGTETGDTTQDSWNIDATVLHVWTNVQAPTSWLNGWDERVKITIDNNDVDNPLSDFPILVHLSNSSGRNNDDATFVFDEVGSNSKKIAVTTSDGTQCYVEIERWDDASEQAWLWVKVPSVSNTTDTELYLYYDMDHADNTVYVGDTGSTAAQNVWDSSFKGVWHLSETSGGIGAIKDSTSNNNVGTDNGSPTFNATGQIDSAISFDGTDDYINVSNSASLQFTSSLTIEAWINLDSFGSGFDVDVILRKGEDNPNDYQLAVGDQLPTLMIEEGDDQGLNGSISLSATTWYYLAGTWNGSIRRVYLNGSEDGSDSRIGPIDPDTRDIYIGGRSGSDLSTGIIDEVRASNTTRSAAWIKASYESGRDDLLGFGSEETRGRAENYDFVLQVTNLAANNWTINLQVYDSSNLARLSKATISFHDGNSSDQIIVGDGSITQSEGSPYNLAGNAATYINISNLQATATGTSFLYVHLKILVPNSSTYILYIITFEIA